VNLWKGKVDLVMEHDGTHLSMLDQYKPLLPEMRKELMVIYCEVRATMVCSRQDALRYAKEIYLELIT